MTLNFTAIGVIKFILFQSLLKAYLKNKVLLRNITFVVGSSLLQIRLYIEILCLQLLTSQILFPVFQNI